MNIQFVGCGDITSHNFYSSLLIDNILINTPPGVIKELKKMEINFDDINIILITQLNAETYFDLPLFLYHESLRERSKPLIIVGPKELKKKTVKLIKMGYNQNILNNLDVTFIDALRIQNANLVQDYRFSFIELKHSNIKTSYGLIIRTDKTSIGYIGEAKPSPGMSYLLKEVKNCIITVGSNDNNRKITLNQFIEITNNYNLSFVPVGYPEEILVELNKIKNTKIIKSYEQFYI